MSESTEQLLVIYEAKLREHEQRLDAQGRLVVELSRLVVDLSNEVFRQSNVIKDVLKSVGILLDMENARQAEAGSPVPPPAKTGVSEVA
jgi:uncharacterized coiled-coil protein SlyX